MDALYLELLEQHPNSGINLTVVHPFTVNTGWYTYTHNVNKVQIYIERH